VSEAEEIQGKEKPEPMPAPPERGSFGWVLWALLFLFVAYPLGIGPAAKLHQHFPRARPVIEAAYKPIVVLVEHSPTARAACMWYLSKIWKVDD
jgi:hypothetical protein